MKVQLYLAIALAFLLAPFGLAQSDSPGHEVSIGYSFRENIIKGLASSRVYFTVQNLYSFQSYEGYNPDFNTGVDETFNPNRNQVLNPGYDFGSYPKPRTILLGVQLTF